MKDISKYQGIIPAFYACYDEKGNISPERVQALTRHLMKKGVKGVYVGGSSGECIYQSVEERKTVLENVMTAAEGRLTVIAHMACNSTRDSVELARHAESLGVDAIAAIPPIYFHLPEHAIAAYWNAISAGAPNTDFIIYNIPQLAGVALTMPLLREMLKNPNVIGVKNSSMPVQDIEMFEDEGTRGGRTFVVFNGPDEQLISGLIMGADGGIGGTYAVMPELMLRMYDLVKNDGDLNEARAIQYSVDNIIYALCATQGNMYATIKEVLRRREGLDLGGVREPLYNLQPEDMPQVDKCVELIDAAMARWIR
ncbi:MAG: dihydrodipicolinate synthase family protein [Oscillospiraceae bacterium]|nr:dihydrodipicolinate synthase family protein [Oscillospiraceae bacterium]